MILKDKSFKEKEKKMSNVSEGSILIKCLGRKHFERILSRMFHVGSLRARVSPFGPDKETTGADKKTFLIIPHPFTMSLTFFLFTFSL